MYAKEINEMNGDTERLDPASQQLDTRAADGGRVMGAANSAGGFLDMIEDGQLSADLHRELGELAAKMSDLAAASGKKQKGKVTITIDLSTDSIAGGQVFMATAKYAVKAPEEKRKATLLFTDERNQFTRSQPRHGQFFGIREVVQGSARVVV
jgi:hypothetical protein